MAKNSIAQFCTAPANFLYIFATDAFINKLGRKAAFIIRAKKANQKKLLNTTAVDEGKTYEAAYNQISEAFKNFYGITPQKALVVLAEGGEVAGKDWSKGVYGVGELGKDVYFYNQSGEKSACYIGENGTFVDAASGSYLDTEVVSLGKDGMPNCVKYTDKDGITYTATTTKKGKWYASAMEYDGVNYNAKGKVITAANMSSIWESLSLSFEKLLNWLLSLFNIQNNTNKQLISGANTQPSQKDGFISDAGISPWILVALAGGLILSGGFGGFWKSAKKSRK